MPPISGKSMRQARQLAPVSRVPHAGQASNSARHSRIAMRASCRNACAVVTECAADYHLRMAATETHPYRLFERAGPARRVQWRAVDGVASDAIVASGYQGAEPPPALTRPRLELRNATDWRVAAEEGSYEFSARAVDVIALRPGLFAMLHRPFALTSRERLAARCLLALLRLPGGARLLRNWHAKRSA